MLLTISSASQLREVNYNHRRTVSTLSVLRDNITKYGVQDRAGTNDKPRPRLIPRIRAVLRSRHYSRSTEKTYLDPDLMGEQEINEFLTHLAVVASNTLGGCNNSIAGSLSPQRNIVSARCRGSYRVIANRPLGFSWII